jgi:hypothetical protein
LIPASCARRFSSSPPRRDARQDPAGEGRRGGGTGAGSLARSAY